MTLSSVLVFLLSGAALTTLGIVLYKRVSEDEKKNKNS